MDKFDECNKISSEIIDNYIDLIFLSIHSTDDNNYKSLLNLIKKLVIKEYELISSMSMDEVSSCLKLIDSMRKNYDDDILYRMRNKLFNRQEVLLGNEISCKELGINSVFANMKFGISDAIMSMVDIDVIKKIKSKIDSLIPTCVGDEKFIACLKAEFQTTKLDLLHSASFAEIFSLCADNDIDRLEAIDINKIRSKFVSLKISNNFDNTISCTMALYAKEILEVLSGSMQVNNNPKDVYLYLVDVTRMEVLMSYMDKNTLNAVYNYCCEISNISNSARVSNVKRLIRRKLNEC